MADETWETYYPVLIKQYPHFYKFLKDFAEPNVLKRILDQILEEESIEWQFTMRVAPLYNTLIQKIENREPIQNVISTHFELAESIGNIRGVAEGVEYDKYRELLDFLEALYEDYKKRVINYIQQIEKR